MVAAATVATVNGLFPAIDASVTTAQIQAMLDEAALSVGKTFGKWQEQAHALYAAHLIVTGGIGTHTPDTTSPAQLLKRTKLGPSEKEYHTPGADMSDELTSTVYGQRFLKLKNRAMRAYRAGTIGLLAWE
ncbi:MAG: DUF4054 domain-containing protein [Myxococcales bacterium FL481]|nr:MAG: DUF4054 domain-containing protein [Myxococcales bacterium FL481]